MQAGKSQYAMCQGCHSPGYNRTGPMHCGIFGRLAGSQVGYQYSEALKLSQLRWNRQTLDRFLEAPVKAVPGTSMTFAGISDAYVRRQLIDYLASLTPDHTDCQ
ncbi:MAG: c-type cytochrome [Motiliproteus sp.]